MGGKRPPWVILRIAGPVGMLHPGDMVQVPESAPVLTVDEVESVRSRLRRSDEESRRAALAAIDGWDGRVVSPAAADSLLRAVTLAYPWVRNPRVDPASRLARALFAAPRAVDVHAVEAAYLVSGERVRRLLLHLLALRRDDDGVGSLVFLLGPDGPADLLPLPVAGMLAPVLSAERAADLVPVLVHLAGRTGWVWHAADLLEDLVVDGRVSGDQQRSIARGLAPVVASIVAACDRATLPVPAQATGANPVRGADPADAADPADVADRAGSDRLPVRVGHPAGRAGRDQSRADRFRLHSLVSLMGQLAPTVAEPVLRSVVASADPRVAAVGAVEMVSLDVAVAPDRLDLIARAPEARAELLDGLRRIGRLEDLAPRWRTAAARAEAELVRWLADDTELGRAPDEIEPVVVMAVGDHPDDGVVHLFRFRMRSPHWSSARGWMIGAAGPFDGDGSEVDGFDSFAVSVYSAEDDDDHDGHLDALLDSLGLWPDADEI